MNAQECRTLTATCTCILNYIPYTLHLNRVLVLLTTHPAPKQGSGTRVSDLRVGGRHLAMSLYKLKASVTYLLQLNYVLES